MVCSEEAKEEAKKQEENIDDFISIDDLIKECQPHEYSAVLSNEQKVLYEKADSTLKKELEKIRNIYKKHYERSSCVKTSDCDMIGASSGIGYFCDFGIEFSFGHITDGIGADPLLIELSFCNALFPISKNVLKEYQNEVNSVRKQCRALVNGCKAILKRTNESFPIPLLCVHPGTACVENKCIITAVTRDEYERRWEEETRRREAIEREAIKSDEDRI